MPIKIMMKNVSRNKFLLCFKPFVDMDQLLLDHSKVGVVDHSKNRDLKHLGRKRKEDMKRLVSNSSLLSDDKSRCSTIISSSENSLILHSPKKNLSRVIQAVFFEIILSERIRDGRGSQCQGHSNGSKLISSSSPMNSKTNLDNTSDHHANINLANKVLINTDHQANEAILVKSCSSSISEPRKFSKIKNSKYPNHELEFKARNMDKSGIYLLLICLTMTILWGKLCAIFCNLIWLYFLPRRQHNTGQPEIVRTSLWLPEKKESKDQYCYKKEVIMEGLLERKHQRVNGIKFFT